MSIVDQLECRAGLFHVGTLENTTPKMVDSYIAAFAQHSDILEPLTALIPLVRRMSETWDVYRSAERSGATSEECTALEEQWKTAFAVADFEDKKLAQELTASLGPVESRAPRTKHSHLFSGTHPRTPGPLVVAIGRDPTLLFYSLSTNGGIMLTTNSFRVADKRIRVISFQDYLESQGLPVENVNLYDTDFMQALDNPSNPNAQAMIPPEYRPHLESFRAFVIHEILSEARGDPVIVNPYHSTDTAYWQSLGFTVLGPREQLAFTLASKYDAWDLARSVNIPVAPGSIVRGNTLIKGLLASLGPIFVSAQDNPFHPQNMKIRSVNEIDQFLRNDVPYLVTGWLKDTLVSPNTQVIIGATDETYLGASVQVLRSDTIYDGNEWPLRLPGAHAGVALELELLTMRYAAALRSMGYRGVCGIDWVVAPDPTDGKMRPFFVELNPRENRSTAVLTNLLGMFNPHFSFFELKQKATNGDSVGTDLRRTFESRDGSRTLHTRMIPFKPQKRIKVIRTPELRTETTALMEILTTNTVDAVVGTIENVPLDGTILGGDEPNTMRIVVYGWKPETVNAEAEKIRDGFFDGYIPTGAVVREPALSVTI
jgi:hypothetical protein